MTMRKDDLIRKRHAWSRAMQLLAADLGKDHWITKGMGSVAWGRFEGESRPNDPVSNVAEGWGFLQGVRYALLHVARSESRDDASTLERIHERMESPA